MMGILLTKYLFPKILIAGDEDPVLTVGQSDDIFIGRTACRFIYGENIMTV